VENGLRRNGVHTVVELRAYPLLKVRGDDREPLLGLRNLSERGVRDILDALAAADVPHLQDGDAQAAMEAATGRG
jgi:hypothetical protein